MKHLALIALVLTSTPLAFAQSTDDQAALLKQQGDEQMRALHFKEALEKYDEALKAGGGAAIHYNRARTLEALGQYPLALDALEEFIRTAPTDLRERVAKLDDLLADLRAHVATVVIDTPVAGATVRIGDAFAGTTPLATPVRASIGDTPIHIEAPGYRPYTQTVHLVTGDNHIEPKLEKQEAVAPPVVVVMPDHAHTTTGSFRPIAVAVGSTGLALVAVGAIFGGLAVGDRSVLDQHCPGYTCDPTGVSARNEAWTFATLSTIGLIAGPILFAGAVVLFFVGPKPKRSASLSASIGPSWVGLSGAF